MGRLMLWFYCLNLWDATILVLGVTGLLVILRKKIKYRRLLNAILLLLLFFWAATVLQYTLWSRTPTAIQPVRWIPLQSYYDVLLGENPERLRSNYMNVLLFYPAGVLLSALLTGKQKHPYLTALGLSLLGVFSILIEINQFRYGIGLAETDDVIHNTLGGILGFYSFMIIDQYSGPVLRQIRKKLN